MPPRPRKVEKFPKNSAKPTSFPSSTAKSTSAARFSKSQSCSSSSVATTSSDMCSYSASSRMNSSITGSSPGTARLISTFSMPASVQNKRGAGASGTGSQNRVSYQYMPPMSGAAGAAGAFSGMSVTRLSVVRTMAETLALFSMALRQTLVGSTMPMAIMSPNLSLAAS